MQGAGRVLVIEDEKAIGRLFKLALGSKGFEVRVVETGEEAIRMLEEWVPDVVTLDLKLPDMDGHQVRMRIRAKSPSLPVVLITGDVERAASEDACLMKPVMLNELVREISKYTVK